MNKTNQSKLSLRTETIMTLSAHELSGVHGGVTPTTTTATSSGACLGVGIAISRSTQGCAAGAAGALNKTNDLAKKHLGFSL